MKPKQKAKELVEKFLTITSPQYRLTMQISINEQLTTAKKCAEYACLEILNANPHSNVLNATQPAFNTTAYWREVKKEVANITLKNFGT